MRVIRRAYSRKDRKVRASSSSMEACIQNLQLPPNGLRDLQMICKSRFLWAESIALSSDPAIITKEIFNSYMELLYSSIYCFAPQGRIGGVTSLKYKQYTELMNTGSATTTQFKTYVKYGYQIVILNDQTWPLMKKYYEVFRPVAANNNSTTSMNRPDSPLWINFDGTPDTRIGFRVTTFFKRFLQIQINTTLIRSLVETTSKDLFDKGSLSQEQLTSLHNINGHSSQITTDYYLKSSRHKDANLIRNMLINPNESSTLPMQQYGNATYSTTNTNDLEQNISSPSSHNQGSDNAIIWGEDHPDRGCASTGHARWTPDEKSYVIQWLDKQEHGSQLSVRCLRAIRADPNARRIFHPRHILDSTRLRDCIRRCLDKMNKVLV